MRAKGGAGGEIGAQLVFPLKGKTAQPESLSSAATILLYLFADLTLKVRRYYYLAEQQPSHRSSILLPNRRRHGRRLYTYIYVYIAVFVRVCVIPAPRNRTPIAGSSPRDRAIYYTCELCACIYTYLYAHTLVYCVRGLFVMVTKRRLYTASVRNARSHT